MREQENIYLEQNLKWLQQNIPDVARTLEDDFEFEGRIQESFSFAAWNCKIEISENKSFYLHSLFDRERELRELTKEITENHTTLVLFGCVDFFFLSQSPPLMSNRLYQEHLYNIQWHLQCTDFLI